MKKVFSNKENILNMIGVLAGMAAIVVGIVIWATATGYSLPNSLESYSFGADFYTEIYRAVKEAEYVLSHIHIFIEDGLIPAVCFLVSFSGFITALLFSRRIVNNLRDDKTAVTQEPVTAPSTPMPEE